jgi:hypothetical protein
MSSSPHTFTLLWAANRIVKTMQLQVFQKGSRV